MSSTFDAFLRSWPSAPWLAALLLTTAGVYAVGWRQLHRRDPARWSVARMAAFVGGLATFYLALASPVEPFASLLLQVHMIQHLLLMMVAPPLIWLGWPLFPLLRGLPRPVRTYWAGPVFRWRPLRRLFTLLTRPAVAWTLFVATTWLWHTPRGYELGLASDAWHAAEHAAMIAGTYSISRRMESNFFSLLGFIGQYQVTVNEDGTITSPLWPDAAGNLYKWREVEPFVWRAVGGKELLSARVADGRVTGFTFEPLSAIMMFEPTPGYKSPVWLMPLVSAGLMALVLTTLAWPVTALTRRHYGSAYPLAGDDARAHRWVRYAALAAVTLTAAWLATVITALEKLSLLSGSLDWWFWVLQILSPIVFIGAAAVGVWNAWVVLRSSRKWYAKLWAVLLAIAFLALLWVAIVYHLIAFDLRY